MITKIEETQKVTQEIEPLCPVFRQCGGCEYQHLPYVRELEIKKGQLETLLKESLERDDLPISPVMPSPEIYHYRHRLDITLRRFRKEGLLLGFQAPATKRMIEVEACPIARKEVSDFIPELKRQAIEKMPDKYKTANLVVRTGDKGKVYWGGIGRRSLRMNEEDYLWTEVNGKRIYFSLETFFQANTYILPSLMKTIEEIAGFDSQTLFLDLYSGVGLFGVYFADRVKRVVLVEEVKASAKIADSNCQHHQLNNVENHGVPVEEKLHELLQNASEKKKIAMIDPPRRGLSSQVLEVMTQAKQLDLLFYLSCHPESLARDLQGFQKANWKIENIIPFDFFPRTRHLETLVVLKP